MIKQVKSIILIALLYKYRKSVITISILLSIVLFSQWIYSDIVEYLKLIEQTEYLHFALPTKWIIIFSCIGISASLILNIVNEHSKNNQNQNKVGKEQKQSFFQGFKKSKQKSLDEIEKSINESNIG